MKRYLVFCYEQYYPGGGWCDFQGSYDTLEEAKLAGPTQIVDSTIGEVIYGERPYDENATD